MYSSVGSKCFFEPSGRGFEPRRAQCFFRGLLFPLFVCLFLPPCDARLACSRRCAPIRAPLRSFTIQRPHNFFLPRASFPEKKNADNPRIPPVPFHVYLLPRTLPSMGTQCVPVQHLAGKTSSCSRCPIRAHCDVHIPAAREDGNRREQTDDPQVHGLWPAARLAAGDGYTMYATIATVPTAKDMHALPGGWRGR